MIFEPPPTITILGSLKNTPVGFTANSDNDLTFIIQLTFSCSYTDKYQDDNLSPSSNLHGLSMAGGTHTLLYMMMTN